MAHHLDPDQPVFALQSIGLEPDMAPDETIEAMAARYVAALRAHQPRRPYHLCGWSFGGWVAYEMANAIAGGGQAVALLAIIDATALTKPTGGSLETTQKQPDVDRRLAAASGPFILPYMRELRAVTDAESRGRHDRKPFFALAGGIAASYAPTTGRRSRTSRRRRVPPGRSRSCAPRIKPARQRRTWAGAHSAARRPRSSSFPGIT
ncbi:MAG: alpha/beta fold hydrolase [Caldilineaceae bacterium]